MTHSRGITGLILLLFLCFGNLIAGVITTSNRIYGSAITLTAPAISASDNNSFDPLIAKVDNASGKVIFSIDKSSTVFIGIGYTVKLGLKITSVDLTGASSITNTELVVNYDPANSYQDKSVYLVNNCKSITAEITHIYGATGTTNLTSIPQNLSLEVEQSTERYYAFDPTVNYFNPTTFPNAIGSKVITASNELEIYWNVIPGAEEYELEWSYVNDYSIAGTAETNLANLFCDFRDNNTRIRISENNYRISLLFDQGYIVYRVRGVGRSFSDLAKELTGDWGVPESASIATYPATHVYKIEAASGHEKNKNWQYSATYAEEGKKKEVVSYFDGSLRNRQSVTKTNTDNQTIVGETIYDFQGRGAIQVLPAPNTDPLTQSIIKYLPDFNKTSNGSTPAPYSRNDFDLDPSGAACDILTAGMSTSSGSSRYYSPSNPDKTGAQAYVPDAKLYPFTQIEYTPDNTGRIRRQSGVGVDHQLSTISIPKHETKYFYGQPEQIQLDRMFGSEVGDYMHYKKNMVVDANGQISVSYLDQQGRVVATSLAGDPSPATTPLESATQGTALAVNYLKADGKGDGGNKEIDNALVFSKELLVATAGDYIFTYDVTLPQYSPCTSSPALCYDCVYDLEISVKDACGANKITPQNVQVGTIDYACNGTITFPSAPNPLNAHLEIGSYTVYKKLKISETAIDAYTNNYIASSACIKPLSDFTTEAMLNIDTNACNMTCAQCVAALGNYTDHNVAANADPKSSSYQPAYVYMTQAQYDNAIKECNAPCQSANLCEAQYQMLLSDVSPGGQYAKYEIDNAGNFSGSDGLSVLSLDNALPVLANAAANSSNWRNPATPYLDNDGTPSKIVLVKSGNSYSPAVRVGATINTTTIGNEVISYIFPQDLEKTIDFINLFGAHNEWAQSLVAYHPEYKYYEWCIKNNTLSYSGKLINASVYALTSDEFDDLLRTTKTYTAADAAQLITASGILDLLDQDPYFSSTATGPNPGQGSSQYETMLGILSDYHSSGKNLKIAAAHITRCGTQYYATTCNNGDFGDGTDNVIRDKEWVLYRNLYLAEKQKLQQIAAEKHAQDPAIKTNGCIGIKDGVFNPWQLGNFSWQEGMLTDPCQQTTRLLYKNKIKRFNNANDIMPGVDALGEPQTGIDFFSNNVNYNRYLETGQCPVTLDLGILLNDLVQNMQGDQKKLLATNNLVQCTGFTKNLYDALDPAHSPFIEFQWLPSLSSTQALTANFVNITGGPSIATLTLSAPPVAWANIKRFANIQFASQSGNISNFTITALSEDAPGKPFLKHILNGSITIAINNCSFPNNCMPTTYALKVQNLFNALKSKGEFNSAAVNLKTAHPPTLPYYSILADNSLVPYAEMTWNAPNSSGATLWLKLEGAANTTNSTFSFNNLNGTSYTNMANVQYFAHIRQHPGGSSRDFDIDGWVWDTPPPNATGHFETIHGFCRGDYDFITCLPPVSLACSGPEYKLNEGFLSGLNTFASQGLLTSTTAIYLNDDFESIFNFNDVFDLSWIVETNNTATKSIIATINGSTGSFGVIEKCKINMTFTNLNTDNSFEQIVALTDLTVPSSGNGNSFTVMAHFGDGTSQLLMCSTTCIQLKTCEKCIGMATGPLAYGNGGFENTQDPLGPGATSGLQNYKGAIGCDNGYLILPADHNNTTCWHWTTPGLAAHSGTNYLYLNYSGGSFSGDFLSDEILWQRSSVSVTANTGYSFRSFYNVIDAGYRGYTLILKINEVNVASVNLTSANENINWYQLEGVWNSGAATSANISIVISKADAHTEYFNLIALDDITLTRVSSVPCNPKPDPSDFPQIPYKNACVEQLLAVADANAKASYNAYIRSEKQKFRNAYTAKCKTALENLKMVYTDKEYHITLYYYDQAGSLIKTVPPAGVALVTDPAELEQIKTDRRENTHTHFTKHKLQTKYEYNSLGQLLRQATPDNELTDKWTLNGASSLPAGSNIYGMALSNGTNGYVVGDDGSGKGIIYTTSDGGATWAAVSTAGIENLKDVQFIGITGYAISEAGYLVKTTDNGASWSILPTGISQKLNDLYFSDASTGIIIGNKQTVLRTTNGGASWLQTTVPQLLSPTVNFNDLHFVNPDIGFLAGDKATVLQTIDAGRTWSYLKGNASPLNTDIKLNAIHFSNENQGYVAGVIGATGKGFIASVNTYSFDPVPFTEFVPTTQSPAANGIEFKSVFVVSNANAITQYAAGTNGSLYRSDNGLAFYKLTVPSLPSGSTITELSFADANAPLVGFATTTTGQIIKSNPAGQWAVLTVPQTTGISLNGLYFNSNEPAVGYIAGANGALFKTVNSGVNWASLTNITLPKLKAACSIPGTSVGYAVGEGGGIVKTTTRGSAWSLLAHTASTSQLNGVAFQDDKTGVAVGNGGTILSISGGNAVTALATATENLNDVTLIPSTLNYVAVGNNGKLIKGTAASFSAITAVNGQNLNSVYFPSSKVGYACGNNGVVLKTENAGSSWAATGSTGVSAALRKIYFKDILTGYAMGDAGTIVKTTDGGLTWKNKTGSLGSTNFYTAAFTDDGQALITGSGTPNAAKLKDESDDFSSRFWYDRLGRLIVSQNTKQFAKSLTSKAYSYTVYDALGRIIQVGEITTTADIAGLANKNGVIADPAAYTAWLAAGTKAEITSTTYDAIVLSTLADFTQENLRTRVSAITIDENGDGTHEHASYFTYDIHGNVKTLIQDNPSLATERYKRTDYEYDLVSGKVNEVKYQDGKPDALTHRYEYDADNRITNVYTTTAATPAARLGNSLWDQDAKYFYYKHGPLARTELGDQKVQGIDYAYTIQGWIKGVNSNDLTEVNDIGKDGDRSVGNTNPVNGRIPKDAFGYSLGYFRDDAATANVTESDYKSIGGNDNFIASVSQAAYLTTDAPNLYNGNISSMVSTITDIKTGSSTLGQALPQLTAYQYDQLNRIKQMKAYKPKPGLVNSWAEALNDNSYQEKFTYDANGNIVTLERNGNATPSLNMDNLHYTYKTHADGRKSNQLSHVDDLVTDVNNYADDIDDQDLNNYTYDEIGNLKSDVQEGIEKIEWTVYGKIKSIIRTAASTKADLEFKYDASGNRVAKIVKPHATLTNSATWTITYYVRDASGNIMGTYKLKENTTDLLLEEQNIFGSSRLGVLNRNLNLTTPVTPTPNILTHDLGIKNYELSNHLGNVLTVVSDRKLAHDNAGVIDYFTSKNVSTTDYYAFGSPMPGRTFNSDEYRYGFNGKEKDDKVKGNGNSYDFGARIYDPRIGRWLAIDPLAYQFSGMSPYSFCANNPIYFIDADGRKFKPASTAEVSTLGNFLKSAFTDKKGNTVDGFQLFGTTEAVFKQNGGPIIKILGTSLSKEEFSKNLKKSKLSDSDKKSAEAFFDKLSSDDVYEVAVVNTTSEATGFIKPDENNSKTTSTSSIKVATSNPKSDELFKVLENPESTTSDKAESINKNLGDKNYEFFENKEKDSRQVKGIIIINVPDKTKDEVGKRGSSDGDTKATNEAVKTAVSNTP